MRTWRRERSDGLYRTISYLLSKMAEELTVILGVSLVNSACIFYAVAFRGEYVLFWLVYLITMSVGMGALPPPLEYASCLHFMAQAGMHVCIIQCQGLLRCLFID